MRSSLKYVLICLCLLGFSPMAAQYTTADYTPTNTVSSSLKAPGRMAIDNDDNIYAVDAINKSIIKYDGLGNYITTITTDFNPSSIAINDSNLIFVGDKSTGNIYIVSENGNKTLFYSGTAIPNSMVFGLNILYITYSQEKKVIGIDTSGNVVTDFTYEKFVYPTGITFDPYNNYILVGEHGGIGEDMERPGSCSFCWSSYGPQTAIYMFNLDGSHVNTFGFFGNDDGQFQRIQGLSVGTCGNYYAVDPFLGQISVFDDYGIFITKFGLQGNGNGEFNLPMDIVFTSDNRAFVSSMNKGAIDMFSIVESLPTATITSQDQTICSNATGSVDINFTGSGPWTFSYTIDGINPTEVTANESPYSLQVTAPGFYEVTALVDADNITGTCFTGGTTINVEALPTATILTADFSKCSNLETGVDVQLTGKAPWTFTYTIDGLNPVEISTSDNLYTLKAEKSGRYEIISLTDATEAGCSGVNLTDNTNVIVHPLPTASITNENNYARISTGEYADFTIAFTGTAPYTFTYSHSRDVVEEFTITTNENFYTLTVSEEGSYEILNITDQYCSNMNWQGYFDIYASELPTATIATTNIEACSGESDDIAIEFTGTAPWTFTYSINEVNPIEITTSENPYQLTTNTPGLYLLGTVSDSNGEGTVSGQTTFIENQPPIIELPLEVNSCEGTSAILDAGTFNSYLWSTGETTQLIEVSNSGNYTLSVTDSKGCSAEASVQVTINPLPVIEMESVVEICEGSIATLNPGEFDTYQWSTDEATQTIEVSNSGNYTVTVTDTNGCSAEATVQVIVNPLPVIEMESLIEICEGSIATLDAGEFDTYLWSTGEATQKIEVPNSGNYTVTVTDTKGCTTEATVQVIVNPLPVIEMESVVEICEGSIATLDPGAFDAFLWSTGETTQTIEVPNSGNYTVTVTDIKGCSAETTVQVIINPLPVIEMESMVEICEGSTATLDPGAFDTYFWSTGEVTQTIEASNSGNYTVTVTDANGCSSEASVQVVVNQLPVIEMESEIEICEGSIATLDAGVFDAYLWSTGETTQTIAVSTSGIYNLIATDANGCSTEATVQVIVNPMPFIEMESTVNICQGTTTLLDAGIFESYLWSTGETSQRIEVSIEGTYAVLVTDSNGCSSEAAVDVIVNPLPIIEMENTLEICEGTTTILDAGVFDSYLWSTGETSQSIEASINGEYSVTVTNGTGCSSVAIVEVIVNELPVLDLGPDLDICETELPYVLDPGIYKSYEWSTGSNSRKLKVFESGTYSVTVKNAAGCMRTASINITVHSMVTADFYYEGTQESIQFYSTATNAESHLWEFGDGTTSTEENPIHTYANKGDYTVIYTSYGEFCSEAQKTELIEVHSSIADDVILIYPNPSSGNFTLKLNPEEPITSDITVLIKSLSGQTIYYEVFSAPSNTSYDGNIYKKIYLGAFSKGMYILSVEATNFSAQDKLILKD